MRRFATILLSLCFLALGTGALEYLHNLDHAVEDARADAAALAAGTPVDQHHHDETNCDVHAQLHVALFVAHWVSIVACIGLFVAFVTLLASPLIDRLAPARIACRGPPCA